MRSAHLLSAILFCAEAGPALAQAPARLVDAAGGEREVVWYTAMNTPDAAPLRKRFYFDELYSFLIRASQELLARLSAFLDRWIHNYVTTDAHPPDSVKARYPLAEAKVEVKEIPGKPGSYNAVAWLRPWLQLEELTTSLRLVASLPQKKA